MTGKEAFDRCIDEAKILIEEVEQNMWENPWNYDTEYYNLFERVKDLLRCMERNREEIDEGKLYW